MKRRFIKVLLTITTTAILVGCNRHITVGEHQTITDKYKTDNIQSNLIHIYHTCTKSDNALLNTLLEQRDGEIIIQIVDGTVLDTVGNGIDNCGYYIHYDTKKFSKGDKVRTVFIYNPNSSTIDDILYRFDTLIK